MKNEDTGIFVELRRRAEFYAAQNETLRRKILGLPWAEDQNPFERPKVVAKPRLPIPSKLPFWRLHGDSRLRRRMQKGDLRDDLDVNPLQIVQAVCAISHLSPGTLLNPCREKHVAYPRQVAIYFIARYCGELSLTDIGFIFGMHHTTCLYGIRSVPKRIDAGCSATRAMVDEVEAMLRQLK